MKKNDKIQDSPEFQYYKDDFENFKKRMEEDKESAELKMPDGWEQDFAKTIDDTLDGNERKRRNRIVKRIVGVAAAVVMMVGIGNYTAVSVSGENLLDMFINKYFVGEKQYDIYGNENEIEFDEDDNENISYFDGTTLDEVSNQIRNELKCPMFYLGYIPDGFTVEEASYNKEFRIISIKLVKDNEYIYIFQQRQVDERASGIAIDNSESITIENSHLNKNINICKNNQDDSWMFVIDEKEIVFSVNAVLLEKECRQIAEDIDYY
ncbi:MAG: DUF4367 domain-containing protein [Eubacterium sp.]|nr:DUF4367 domain-containing protein [Eubacterium sp.]